MMKTRLEILHLRMIKSIADIGNVTKAAEHLGISQPALSHRIKEAERRLGRALFERQGKRLQLTNSGKRLLYSANLILTELENAEFEISILSSVPSYLIKIGIKPHGCHHWLADTLSRMGSCESMRNVDLSLETMADPLLSLSEGAINIAIVSHSAIGDSLHAVQLFKDEMLGILSKEHCKARKKFLQHKDFFGQTYIAYETTPEKGREYELFLGHEAITLVKVIKAGVTDAIVDLVERNLGVTILTRSLIEPYLGYRNIVAVPLTRSSIYVDWFAVTRKDQTDAGTQEIIHMIGDREF